MPYFSFSIHDNNALLNEFNIKPNQVYFSKSTYIWRILNKEKYKNICTLNREKRKKISKIGKSILFCLPPSIGLGDAIEYAHALRAIKKSNIFKNIGIAFTEKCSFIFNEYFELSDLYPFFISKEIINKYETLFHFTLEIEALKIQKYIRSNIENEIKSFFKIISDPFIIKSKKYTKIKKISIFPISNSPIRTMPFDILEKLLNFFKQNFIVEAYFDKNSEISNYLLEKINQNNISIIDCRGKKELVNSIQNIEYGVFMDSGPLHIAKLFNKKGVLIESSVSSKTLLNKNKNIISINNKYSSPYCKSPCGLTDLFNYNGKCGCYENLKIVYTDSKIKNLFEYYSMRGVKNNYITHIENPVGCLRSLDVQNILNYIKKDLRL